MIGIRMLRFLPLLLVLVLPFSTVYAEDTVEPSGYTPVAGESFSCWPTAASPAMNR